MTSRPGPMDSYRPRQRSRSLSPQSRGFTGDAGSRYQDKDFDFKHTRSFPPTGPYNRDGGGGDSHRHRRDNFRSGPSQSRGGWRGNGGRGGGRGGDRKDGNGYRKKPYVPLPAHDRPILSFDYREKTPELMAGMVTSGFDTVEDEGEGERKGDPEGTEENDAEECPKGKAETDDSDVAMILSDELDNTAKAPSPQNTEATPDEPPPSSPKENGIYPKLEIIEGKEFVEADKKRIDVIAMIRQAKAKAAAEKVKKDTVAANDDFISLDFSPPPSPSVSEDSGSDYERSHRKIRKLNDDSRSFDKSPESPVDVPGKPFSHRENLHGPYVPKQALDAGPPGADSRHGGGKLPPPPGPSKGVRNALGKRQRRDQGARYDSERSDEDEDEDEDMCDPEIFNSEAHHHLDIPLSRKRKHDEFSRDHAIDGNIKREFRPKPGINHIPWLSPKNDHSRTLHMSMWLHKEIVDFIDWIKPRDYEHAVRRYAIGMLRKTVQRMWNDADVRVFGSFASDLYLPTSDVDVVIVSQSYVLDDYPKYSTKRHFFEIAAAIRKSGLSRQDSVKTIANAKVPIVKYVDNATGLHIDISFENKSGLIANGTFRQWRGRYRSMPILLILLKQYLAMRGLNEVYLGGVGSFSLCCLIVSLFQQLPSVVSKEVDPSKNLGVILLEFLEFYGKRFNTRKVGIRVDLKSPGYFDKEELQPKPHNPKPQDETLLVIQDPNNADNNISRSSFMITTVLACFSEAYDTLIKQMRQFDQMDFKQRKGRSLLGTLIGGDYSEMIAHRALLRRVYVERVGKEEDMKAPPPPPRPPPPPPSDVRESFSITSTTIPSLPSHSSIPSIPAIPPPSQMPRLPPPPGLPVRPPPKQLPSPPPGLPVRPPMAPEEPSKKGSQKGKGQQSARGGKNANKKGNHGSGGGSTGNTTGGNNSGIPSVSVDKIAGNSVGGSAQGDIDEGVDGGSKNNPKKPLVIDLGNSESDNEVEIIKIKDGKSLDHIQGQGGRGEGMGVGISREGGKCEATSGGSAPLEPSGNESDPIPLD